MIRDNIPDTLKKFKETEIECSHHYAHVVAYMRETSNSLTHIIQPAFNHLDNKHPIDKGQTASIKDFNAKTSKFFDFALALLNNRSFEKMDELVQRRDELIQLANEIFHSRIKILKKTQKGAKENATYMEMLMETKGLLLNLIQLIKADMNLQQSIDSVSNNA